MKKFLFWSVTVVLGVGMALFFSFIPFEPGLVSALIGGGVSLSYVIIVATLSNYLERKRVRNE
ncbi:MAG TPA: hypothetical protein ENI23_00555 [bacterium]|nr:hypothetical protein [bacterium]